MANIDKISVKNTVFNIISPAVVSDYIEVIGGACTKPDGYEENEVILAKQNDVQLLFKATQDIAFGANIVENTNCVRTTLEEVLKNAGGGGGASSADQVSYDNSASGLEAENVQEAVDELASKAGNASSQIQTLANKAYQTDDATETALASDDLVPFYDTSATAKKKMSVANLIGQTVSNPNLFDNPWFTVNQRGQSSYASGYGFDRWLANSISKNNDVITFTTAAAYAMLHQHMEKGLLANGEKYTLSFLDSNGVIRSVTFTYDGESTGWVTIRVWSGQTAFYCTYRNEETYVDMAVFDSGQVNQSISFKAVKLEKGSVSTLALDTPPNYAEELLKCQRYFVRLGGVGSGYPLALGRAHNTTQGRYLIKLPVEMRATAVVTCSDLTVVRELCNHQQLTPTAFLAGQMDKGGWLELYTTTSGLVTDEVCALIHNAAYFDVSADL